MTRMNRIAALSVIVLVAAVVTSGSVLGHGGKTHGSTGFTHLAGLQKAMGLYDKLISSGKLDESWETTLRSVTVSPRTNNDREELVIAFSRRDGNPDTVYIFFTMDGRYAGSNFTGE